jgi:hypothetical protein
MTAKDLQLIENILIAAKDPVVWLEELAIEEIESLNGKTLHPGPQRDRWGTVQINLRVLRSKIKAAELRLDQLLGK